MTTRILAIEPDRDSGHALQRFVQSCVEADLLVVDSVEAALAAIAEFRPLVVLVSELVSSDDDVNLTAHVRASASGRHVPILSVPALGGEQDADAPARGLLRLIASGSVAHEARTLVARRQVALRQALQAALAIPRDSQPAASEAHPKPARAPRWKASNIPWLTRVTLPLGLEVDLVNISRTGLLIESRSAFVVEQPTKFELHGRLHLVAPGRFVRMSAGPHDRAGRDGLYRAAAVFDHDLPVFAPRVPARGGTALVPSELTEVLDWVRYEAREGLLPERIRSAFELGIQSLVGAREVHVCRVPVQADGPGDSLCLTVPTSDGTEAFLQAIYDRARPPSPTSFQHLKAAATLAADVIEMEHAAQAARVLRS
jgi:hypothetical protein